MNWFPVTAELCSATRERLRGVLVDARLGVTGRGCGAHGLSGRRPIANSFSQSRSIGLDSSVSVCAVKLPDPQNSAIGHDGEGAAAWGACRPFGNRINVAVAIIDVSVRGSANHIDASDGMDTEPARSFLG